MYIYVSMYICISVWVCIYAYLCEYVYMHIIPALYVHTICMNENMRTHRYTRKTTHTYMHNTYIYTSILTHIYVYIYRTMWNVINTMYILCIWCIIYRNHYRINTYRPGLISYYRICMFFLDIYVYNTCIYVCILFCAYTCICIHT